MSLCKSLLLTPEGFCLGLVCEKEAESCIWWSKRMLMTRVSFLQPISRASVRGSLPQTRAKSAFPWRLYCPENRYTSFHKKIFYFNFKSSPPLCQVQSRIWVTFSGGPSLTPSSGCNSSPSALLWPLAVPLSALLLSAALTTTQRSHPHAQLPWT